VKSEDTEFCILHLETMNTELKRVLLVDDSPRDTELALNALAQNNLANEVVALRDGRGGARLPVSAGSVRRRAAGQPAVVLLDLKMPKVDGIEVLRQIKNDPQLKMIPVVVMTSSRERAGLGHELPNWASTPTLSNRSSSRNSSRR